MQIVFLVEVLVQCSVRVVPLAEIVELPTNLLSPPTGCVGKEREVGIGLLRLVPEWRFGRIRHCVSLRLQGPGWWLAPGRLILVGAIHI